MERQLRIVTLKGNAGRGAGAWTAFGTLPEHITNISLILSGIEKAGGFSIGYPADTGQLIGSSAEAVAELPKHLCLFLLL